MKKFLIKVLIFALTFILLVFALDQIIVEGIKTSNYREITKWHEVVSGNINTEVLFVGSSRALVHFDCVLYEKIVGKSCYNLGFNGTNVAQQIKMLQLYLRKNQKPEKVIWALDYHMFEDKKRFFGYDQLIPFMTEPEIKELLESNDIDNPWLYYFPVARFSFNKKMKWVGINNYFNLYKNGVPVVKGYSKQDKVWDGKFEEVRKNLKNPLVYRIHIQSKCEFLSFLGDLKVEGVEIQFVFPPVYFELNDIASNEEEIRSEFEGIAHDLGIIMFDYSEDEIGRNKEYFYNSLHLNMIGVELFNKDFFIKTQKHKKN